MGTTAQKLQNIIDSKAAISAAIESKGGVVPTELTGYGNAVLEMPNKAKQLVDGTITEVTAADLSGTHSIGEYAFAGCDMLSSVTIPDNITLVRRYAFQYCYSLESVTFEAPSNVEVLSDRVFSICSSLQSLSIPNSVSALGSYALGGCEKLSSITIDSMVAPTLMDYVFGNTAGHGNQNSFTGNDSSSLGTNVLRIPTGATGYNTEAWTNWLLDASKCGFHIEYF